MVALGVASFGHLGGIHYQNLTHFDQYCKAMEEDSSIIRRALLTTEEERFIRELILQWKLGKVSPGYFIEKFGIDLKDRFSDLIDRWKESGDLFETEDELVLSRDALLRVDSKLHELFLPKHQDSRYV